MVNNKIIIALFFCVSRLASQDSLTALKIQEVIDLFGSKSKGIWITHYTGIASNGDAYLLTLGHNQLEQRGFLQFPSRSREFYVEGPYYADQIKLVVQDSSFEHRGFLLGDVSRSRIIARFMDPKNESGIYIEFEKVGRDGFKILKCPSAMWYRSYEGIMDQNPVVAQLQKDSDLRIFGTLSVPGKLTGYLVNGHCDDDDCNQMSLRLNDYFGERIKEFRITNQPNNKAVTEEIFKSKYPINEDWTKTQQYRYECKNMSAPGLKIYAQYIQTGDRDFDQWLLSFFEKWADQLLAYYKAGPVEQTLDCNAYMDIDWISQDWISGIFRFVEPWGDGERNLAFNYDRKLNRIISLEEMFEKDFDYKSFFKEYIDWKKQEMMSLNPSGRFKIYMELEHFKNCTLKPEGFCFTSEFNLVWGVRKIIMPYTLLQPHIRKAGPLRKLF